jgi:hypothetical protein
MTDDTSYIRGQIDGEVKAHLRSHDARLDRAEQMLTTVTRDLNSLVLATAHLEEAAKADKETAIATAKALADAEASRREKGKERWTPIERFTAIIASIIGLTGWVYLIAHIAGLA